MKSIITTFHLTICGGLFLLGVACPAAETSAPDPLAEALPILQTHYIDFNRLQVKPADHLSDLIARSSGGISLVPGVSSLAPKPILTATLPGPVLYWRLETFTPATNWTELAAQLEQGMHQGAQGVVLDLRSNQAPNDYTGAVQVASLFTPAGTPLFSTKSAIETGQTYSSAGSNVSVPGPIVVLIDRQTTGSAEVLAAGLRVRGALVVGGATSGHAELTESQKLSTGQVLRYATNHVFLADGSELTSRPVTPDIAFKVNDEIEKNVLAAIDQNSVLDVIHVAAQSRKMSEASLVRGNDPEMDDYLAAREKKPDAPHDAPAILDTTLIGALDSLKAIRLSQRPEPPTTTEVSPEPASSLQ